MMESMIPSVLNTYLNFIAAKSNQLNQAKIAKANLAQQKELTEQQWANDSAAFQTAVEDARKAGLSPLAAIDHPTMWSNAIYSDQVAPQFDASGITASLASMSNVLAEENKNKETQRHNLEEEKAAKNELEFRTQELESKNDQLSKTIKNHNAQVIYESKTKTNQDREKDSTEFISNFKNISGFYPKIKNYNNYDGYITALAKSTKEWQEIEEILASNPEWKKLQQSSGTSSNTSGGAFSVSGGKSESSNWSEIKNKEWFYTEAIKAWEKGAKEWPRANSDIWKSERKREFTLPKYTAKEEELTYNE